MKQAIDVALLPPENIMDICIELNRKDPEAFSVLNSKDNLPHITLAMGVMDENNLQKINEAIDKISKKFFLLNLEVSEVYYEITPENKKSYGFAVKPTKELIGLHHTIMKELLPILSYDVELDMFYKKPNETINEVSKFWVENYGKKHADPKNYYPHISLKCRNAQYNNLPIKFTVSRLVLCQLGDYCTCKKLIKEFSLISPKP